MSAFSAAAVVEELVDATSTLREENEALRQALLNTHKTLEMTARAGAHHAMAAECLRETVIRWASRAEQAEGLLESIGAGGVGKLEQPPVVKQNRLTATQKDAVFEASIDFIGTLTGMKPPPIEVAPPEIFKPFRDYAERVCSIFSDAPQPPRQPLPDEQIKAIHATINWHEMGSAIAFARAIERAHRIGGEA